MWLVVVVACFFSFARGVDLIVPPFFFLVSFSLDFSPPSLLLVGEFVLLLWRTGKRGGRARERERERERGEGRREEWEISDSGNFLVIPFFLGGGNDVDHSTCFHSFIHSINSFNPFNNILTWFIGIFHCFGPCVANRQPGTHRHRHTHVQHTRGAMTRQTAVAAAAMMAMAALCAMCVPSTEASDFDFGVDCQGGGALVYLEIIPESAFAGASFHRTVCAWLPQGFLPFRSSQALDSRHSRHSRIQTTSLIRIAWRLWDTLMLLVTSMSSQAPALKTQPTNLFFPKTSSALTTTVCVCVCA